MDKKEILIRAAYLFWVLLFFSVLYQFIIASQVYDLPEYYYAGFALYFVCISPIVYWQIQRLKLPKILNFCAFIPILMFPLAIYLGFTKRKTTKWIFGNKKMLFWNKILGKCEQLVNIGLLILNKRCLIS